MTLAQQWWYPSLLITTNSFHILFPANVVVGYRQTFSSRLYVLSKGPCSLDGRTLSNTGE